MKAAVFWDVVPCSLKYWPTFQRHLLPVSPVSIYHTPHAWRPPSSYSSKWELQISPNHIISLTTVSIQTEVLHVYDDYYDEVCTLYWFHYEKCNSNKTLLMYFTGQLLPQILSTSLYCRIIFTGCIHNKAKAHILQQPHLIPDKDIHIQYESVCSL
jgi:hypothetical protein